MAASSESGEFKEDSFIEKESTNLILQLPDELVMRILSGLTLKEAVRTSVISKRWINLWKSADLVLDFDYTNEFKVIYNESDFQLQLAKLQQQFKNWVNGVLNQQKNASRIIKFRIAFMFTGEPNSERDIGRWIKFAISKRVEFLDLAFTSRRNYVFSEDCYNHIKTPTGLSEIKSLRSLRLSFVDIQETILEHVIANCPLLEEFEALGSKDVLEREMTYPLSGMNELTCLERLTIEANGYYKEGIIGLIPLINQCPRLHTLQVNFLTLHEEALQADVYKSERGSIKSVEIVGFRGGFTESEFVKYVMQYFVGLERIKIVIDRNQYSEKQANVAKEVALELKLKASLAVEFVVI